MSNKPELPLPLANPVTARLSHMSVAQLLGRDAGAFAQSQFTSDVAALGDGQWQWSAWLTPKGRVIAVFLLLRMDAERFWAVLPDMHADDFATQLGRFVFRSKVKITAHPVAVSGVRDTGVPATVPVAQLQPDDAWLLPLMHDGSRALLLGAVDSAPAQDAEFTSRWRLDDIAHGLPRLQDSAVEAYTPQMLGLDRLAAYSLRKGCYPGQEIVSRTHYLGQAKRGLLRVALQAPAQIGERLQSDVGSHADVVCSETWNNHAEALLVAALEPAASHWTDADGVQRATPLPLLDGLLR